jgi:hypothetical protein
VLVFSANLEEIEEIGGRGVDGNEVLVRFGGRCGQLDDFEILGPLDIG